MNFFKALSVVLVLALCSCGETKIKDKSSESSIWSSEADDIGFKYSKDIIYTDDDGKDHLIYDHKNTVDAYPIIPSKTYTREDIPMYYVIDTHYDIMTRQNLEEVDFSEESPAALLELYTTAILALMRTKEDSSERIKITRVLSSVTDEMSRRNKAMGIEDGEQGIGFKFENKK